eukprot:7377758-Prymnesium_polylepis.1
MRPSRLLIGFERMVGHFGASVSAHTALLGLSMRSRDDPLLPGAARTSISSRGCRHTRRRRATYASAARRADGRSDCRSRSCGSPACPQNTAGPTRVRVVPIRSRPRGMAWRGRPRARFRLAGHGRVQPDLGAAQRGYPRGVLSPGAFGPRDRLGAGLGLGPREHALQRLLLLGAEPRVLRRSTSKAAAAFAAAPFTSRRRRHSS